MMKSAFNLFLTISVFLAGFITPVLSSASVTDNPGGDQPDESFLLGDLSYPSNPEEIRPVLDKTSGMGIFNGGYSRESVIFFSQFLPVRILNEEDLSSRELSTISILIIPSGGLSQLQDPDKFRDSLRKYVENGGIIFVFSQRFGKDYGTVPIEGKLKAYGWLEDQSSLYRSTILTMWHPIVSGLKGSKTHLNLDGFITSYPANGKPLLRNSISAQPVLLYFKQGKGSIIVSTLFTDWAYLHNRATRDEIALFYRLISWSGLKLASSAPSLPDGGRSAYTQPVPLPSVGFSIQSDHEMYESGKEATFTISLWNYRDSARTIHVFYDGNSRKLTLMPHGYAEITYASTVYSSRRLWVYFHDENEIYLQTLTKGYTVLYPVSIE